MHAAGTLKPHLATEGQKRYEATYHGNPTTGTSSTYAPAGQLLDPRNGNVIDSRQKLVAYLHETEEGRGRADSQSTGQDNSREGSGHECAACFKVRMSWITKTQKIW